MTFDCASETGTAMEVDEVAPEEAVPMEVTSLQPEEANCRSDAAEPEAPAVLPETEAQRPDGGATAAQAQPLDAASAPAPECTGGSSGEMSDGPPPEAAEQKKELGNAAFKAKKHQEAIQLYGEAIEEAGHLAPFGYFSNRAVCRATLGDFEGACEDARQALQKPGGVTKKVFFQKVRAEIRLGRKADAMATLELAGEHGLRADVERLLKDSGAYAAADKAVGKPVAKAVAKTAAKAVATPAAAPAAPEPIVEDGDPVATAKAAGTARYKEGAYRDALTEYQRALSLLDADDTERRVQLLGNVAAAYLMLRKVSECCSTCEEALSLDPTNSKIRARLATAQVARGEFDTARATILVAEDCEGDASLANARRQIDEHERALAAADAMLANGEPARALGKFAELETKALFDSPAVALRMGRCYLELKNYPRVLGSTQQVLRANPRNIDALVLRTEALYRNNSMMVEERNWVDPMEQGQKLLKEALSFDPDHRGAQALRKRLRSLCNKKAEMTEFINNREFEQARLLIDTMATETSDNPAVLARLYCHRALMGIRLKDWRSVIKDVGQATYRDHELVQPYLYRSQALQALDRHEDAIKDLEGLFAWHRTESVHEKLQDAKFLLRKSKRPNYYELLKVMTVASQQEIKKAYRERAGEWHPDKKSHLDEACRKNAEEMFKRIGEAYEVLTSEAKKELYDKGHDLEGIEEQLEMKKRRQGGCGGMHFH